MAGITQDAVTRRDCTAGLETATFDGELVNWEDFNGGLEKVTEDFNVGSAGVDGWVALRDKVSPLRIRLKQGLETTFPEVEKIFADEEITSFTMTGWPDHATMVSKYGKLGCTKVSLVQPEGASTIEIELRYGMKTHGFTPA